MTQIELLVEQLTAAKKFKTDSQEQLLGFFQSDAAPLDYRFEIWKEFVDKQHHQWVLSNGEVGPIGGWVRDCKPFDYEDRGRDYTWEDFLTWVEEAFEEQDEDWATSEWATDCLDSVDHFKEILMTYNFGSFCNDW